MNQTILLIAGQPKAGTTSLFNWLVQHRDISGASLKELRFFLDQAYPLSSPARYDGENFQKFFSFFDDLSAKVFVDASPDYFSCRTPLEIQGCYPNIKVIIIIRESVSRMKSAYRFFKARGRIPTSMSFDSYVWKQETQGVNEKTPVQYRALDHCRVNFYLSRWREVYAENLLVLDFDELKDNPRKVVDSVLDFLDIPKSSVNDINTTAVANRTTDVRFPFLYRLYSSVRRLASTYLIGFKRVHVLLSPISRFVDSALTADGKPEEIVVSESVRDVINKKVLE